MYKGFNFNFEKHRLPFWVAIGWFLTCWIFIGWVGDTTQVGELHITSITSGFKDYAKGKSGIIKKFHKQENQGFKSSQNLVHLIDPPPTKKVLQSQSPCEEVARIGSSNLVCLKRLTLVRNCIFSFLLLFLPNFANKMPKNREIYIYIYIYIWSL